jgi:putative addiction module component (TIGR02574 family)
LRPFRSDSPSLVRLRELRAGDDDEETDDEVKGHRARLLDFFAHSPIGLRTHLPEAPAKHYAVGMSSSTRRLLQDVLALPENERLELASEIIASVDGPGDGDWEAAWLAELGRRVERANARGDSGADWTDARARILKRLGRA